MTGRPIHRLTWILGGMVLLLAGALGGVLLTVARMDSRVPQNPRPTAEQVRLGPSVIPPEPIPDTLERMSLPDPARMNDLFRLVANRVTNSVVYIEVDGRSGQMIPPELLRPFDDGRGDRRFDAPRQSV
ncbi:MAG TPA: hypothetical protein VMO47_02190, partial [Rhodothermales bacterium]|nr:hypothetical protein [Rhodothermales bacterium]